MQASGIVGDQQLWPKSEGDQGVQRVKHKRWSAYPYWWPPRGMQLNGGMGDQKLWPRSEGDHLLVKKNRPTGKRWSPRKKGGLPPYYHLPNNETRVHARNEPTLMRIEGSGAKTRSRGPRKLTIKHRKWRATTTVVSRATISL